MEEESGQMLRLPRESMPSDAREGDVLALRDGAYVLDTEATQRRREHIAAIRKRVLDKKQGGRGDA